jgi:hypothetical protein
MRDEELPVGRMPGRGREEREWRFWVVLSAVAGLLTLGWYGVTDPTTRPWVAGMLVAVPVLFASFLNLDTWLDTAHGRLRHRRAWLVPWEVRWAEATTVRFRSNHFGAVVLQVRGRRSIFVPVVADDMRGPRSQPPALLRLLADEIRRWAPARHHGVAGELDAQADHLDAGGLVADSPVLADHAGPTVHL